MATKFLSFNRRTVERLSVRQPYPDVTSVEMDGLGAHGVHRIWCPRGKVPWFPLASDVFFTNCDKHFVYHWMNSDVFPFAKKIFLNSHPAAAPVSFDQKLIEQATFYIAPQWHTCVHAFPKSAWIKRLGPGEYDLALAQRQYPNASMLPNSDHLLNKHEIANLIGAHNYTLFEQWMKINHNHQKQLLSSPSKHIFSPHDLFQFIHLNPI
jgi:hypothetical protein